VGTGKLEPAGAGQVLVWLLLKQDFSLSPPQAAQHEGVGTSMKLVIHLTKVRAIFHDI